MHLRLIVSCLVVLTLLVTSVAQTGWKNAQTIRMKVHEKGDLVTEKDWVIYRKGARLRIEGTYAVGGAFSRQPHVRIVTEEGSYLFVPGLNAALLEAGISASDRVEVVFPAQINKALFSAPASLLEKELKRPARFEGEETVIGRNCYVLTTTDPRSKIHQEKQWIDQTFGLVLRYQRLEAGKVVYEREVKDAGFNEPIDDSLFVLPEGVTVVQGGVSPMALERLRTLGDATAFERELAAQVQKSAKTLNLTWVSTIVPPESMKHATTVHRLIRTVPNEIRPLSGQGLPPGVLPRFAQTTNQRVWMDSEGNTIAVRIVGDGIGMEEVGLPLQRVQVEGDPTGGQVTVDIQVAGEDQIVPPDDRRLPPDLRRRLEELRAARREAAARQAPNEGIFISEFIDPSTGKTLVFVQSKHNDPTSLLASRAPLGASESTRVNDADGTLYRLDKPFQRVTLVWKQGEVWFGLSSCGLTSEELLRVAKTLRRFR